MFWYNRAMSGHSKWSTIKRKKGVNDVAKGKIFSKYSKLISVAVKTGGGADPSTNYKLRMVIDAARAVNMPKANIDRVLRQAQDKQLGDFEEIIYEGFGPHKVSVIVEALTDNRNRTGQEIKGLFEHYGGAMGGPGSAAFNFEQKGYISLAPQGNVDEQMLALIDLGVDDVSQEDGEIVVWTPANQLFEFVEKIKAGGWNTLEAKLARKPLVKVEVPRANAEAFQKFIEAFLDHDDVQEVYTNAELEK